MSLHARLLFANDAFYHAFREQDYAAMEGIWARTRPVSCIHPGWTPLFGRKAVMESWANILSAPGAPQVLCRAARPQLFDDFAYVLCYEVIGQNVLTATNIFVQDDRSWQLVHHQAGPCNVSSASLPDEQVPPVVQ